MIDFEIKTEDKNMNELLQLYFAFFRIGGLTFGGGLTMLPMLKYELVEKKNWVTEDDLLNYLKELSELDIKIKSGAIDKRLGMELFLSKI